MTAPLDLAEREAGPAPYRYDFPTLDAYLRAWHYWRAVRNDGYLTTAELDARHGALEWAVSRRPRDARPANLTTR
jgi:hypothetical protein